MTEAWSDPETWKSCVWVVNALTQQTPVLLSLSSARTRPQDLGFIAHSNHVPATAGWLATWPLEPPETQA